MLKTIVISVFIIGLLSNPLIAKGNAPDFTLERLNGGKFVLADQLKKGPVLIDFWATWCKPCLKALPYIQQIHENYADKGLQVVTISTDSPKGQSKIKPFIKSNKYNFEVLLDSDQEVRSLFGGTVIPFSALINSDGDIVYSHLGYKSGDEKKWIEAIEKMFHQAESDDAGETGDKSQ